jgi:hypothetical protein
MPNWCENELVVQGEPKIVDLFVRAAKGKVMMDFNAFVPYPSCFKLGGEDMDGYNAYGERDHIKSGYDWCHDNWGTKWNAQAISLTLKKKKKGVLYSFDTAWAPPERVVIAMSRIFKTLTFTLKYWEMGSAFRGIFKVKGGEVLINHTYDYKGNRGG